MAIWATAQTGETAKHVEKHLYSSFAVLGVPREIKTDNGPAYLSTRFQRFCILWGIKHNTGIPHSPTGQAIVERAHQTLKQLLQKQKGGMSGMMPAERLNKALYVLNFLRLTGTRQEPPMMIHSLALKGDAEQSMGTQQPLVMFKDLNTGQWEGPVKVQLTGRGYMCLLTDHGPRWVPSHWVRPWKGNQACDARPRNGSDSD